MTAPDTPDTPDDRAASTVEVMARELEQAASDTLHHEAAALLRRLAAALPKPVSDDAREEIASVLEQVARDGLPQPRDLDVAIDAILSILAGD